MNKRVLLLTGCAALAMAAFFGCGDDEDNSNGNKKDDPQESSQCADCVISDFTTLNPPAIGTIDDKKGTIVCSITSGSVSSGLSSVKPVVDVPDGYTVSPESMVPQDFSDGKSVTYTVTNGECTKSYQVSFEKKSESGGGEQSCDCERNRYGIKQGFVTYVDHADGDKKIYYLFDDYGRKEHQYTADDCGWAGVVYDQDAQTMVQYGHGSEGGERCVFQTTEYPYQEGTGLQFNSSQEIKQLLASASLVNAKAISGTVAERQCEGVEMASLKMLQYNCLLLFVSGNGKSLEAVSFSESLPANPFSPKK